jgi:PAS domain S-box-containing protein
MGTEDDGAPQGDLGELASEGILVLDSAGVVVRANIRAHELIPGIVSTLKGAEFWDVIPEDVVDQHQSHVNRALQSGKTYTVLHHDEFAGRWVEYAFMPAGDIVVVHLRDVSDRHRLMGLLRESERRSQGLFEANPNVMWVFDTESLQILAVNRAAIRFYGYSRDDFLAMTANKLYPDSDEKELRNSLPVMDAHPSAGAGTRLCKQRKRGGQVQMVELSGMVIDWSGKRAVLVTLADVTARYLSDAQLRNENAELELRMKERTRALQDALRELGALQYAMSHDMQSPLHAVDGFTKVLLSQYGEALGEQGRHYLNRIRAGTEKMARLIEDLRMLSRISRLAMNPQELDLSALALQVMENLQKREPSRVVDLEIEPGLTVFGDQELVTTALMAMLDNAWKFTSRKEQTWIKVGVALGKNREERVLFVSDNGAGYDPAYSSKLFTAFQRLHSSADFPGAGLGLVLVQRVAMRHGGQVWSESTPMSGATFYLSLPVKDASTKPEAATGAASASSGLPTQVQTANR